MIDTHLTAAAEQLIAADSASCGRWGWGLQVGRPSRGRRAGYDLNHVRMIVIRIRDPQGGVAAAADAIHQAVLFHLDGLRADGAPIPAPSSKVDYVEVTDTE